MDDVALGPLVALLVVLLIVSGFFSMAETSLMAINRYRLRHLTTQGRPGAAQVTRLLENTDRLLGVLLLGNNFINAAAASIVTVVTVRWLGSSKWSLTLGTVAVTLVILIFSEITPKVVGATYAEPIALRVAYLLQLLLRLLAPLLWFINLFVRLLLKIAGLRIRPDQFAAHLSLEELRQLVLEGGHFIPHKHQNILLNLLSLKDITVDDVMTSRHQIEGIDLDATPAEIQRQLTTANHTIQLLYHGSPEAVAGILHLRKVLSRAPASALTASDLQALMQPAYFIPSGTPLLTQLQHFQESRSRLGLVVDEYGELQGLVAAEDILEEIVGEFQLDSPNQSPHFTANRDGTVLVEGICPLRELNRKLGTNFSLEGPRTLNGLILEFLEDIPVPGTSLKIAGTAIEIVQTQDRRVRVARLTLPEDTKPSALPANLSSPAPNHSGSIP